MYSLRCTQITNNIVRNLPRLCGGGFDCSTGGRGAAAGNKTALWVKSSNVRPVTAALNSGFLIRDDDVSL